MDKEKEIRQIADAIIVKALKGELSPKESSVFSEWLERSEENRKLFQRVSEERYLMREYEKFKRIDAKQAWRYIQRKQRRRLRLRVARYAAACVLAVGLVSGYFLLDMKSNGTMEAPLSQSVVQPGTGKAFLVVDEKKEIFLSKENTFSMRDSSGLQVENDSVTLYYHQTDTLVGRAKNEFHTLYTERGGEYSVMLADGTKVYVNSDSKLRYPIVFDSLERRVFLEGEAYFEVRRDEKRPFVVEMRGFSVDVLGTSFNVSNYQSDEVNGVVLVEGRVRVNKDGREYLLKPNEELVIKKDDVCVRKVNARNAISWKNDKFYFNDETLTMVMNTLTRWYDVDVVFANQSVRDYHFSGFVPKYEDIAKAFEILELTCDIKFVLQDRTVIITQRE